MQAESVYFHFPFCEVKCHYCDFYSLAQQKTRPQDPTLFETRLIQEIREKQADLAPHLKTLFLGGGTPSLTSPESMKKILDVLWEYCTPAEGLEWTMEANPASLTLERAKAYRHLGVNRVSLGVQALRDDFLKLLGRVHAREAVFEALEILVMAGFQNISVDLLAGVPGQSVQDLHEAIQALLSCCPLTHLSCYLLTLPPQHPLFSKLPSPDEQLQHYLAVHDDLTSRGFQHYEISNYCLPGYESRHNLNYWGGQSYLGLGPSAHSYDASLQRRWKNVSSLHRYAAALEASALKEAEESLTEAQQRLETWMLAIRLREGFPDAWFPESERSRMAQYLRDQGWGESFRKPGSCALFWRLTPKGWALSDELLKLFVSLC